jgi:hypothetical protein
LIQEIIVNLKMFVQPETRLIQNFEMTNPEIQSFINAVEQERKSLKQDKLNILKRKRKINKTFIKQQTKSKIAISSQTVHHNQSVSQIPHFNTQSDLKLSQKKRKVNKCETFSGSYLWEAKDNFDMFPVRKTISPFRYYGTKTTHLPESNQLTYENVEEFEEPEERLNLGFSRLFISPKISNPSITPPLTRLSSKEPLKFENPPLFGEEESLKYMPARRSLLPQRIYGQQRSVSYEIF